MGDCQKTPRVRFYNAVCMAEMLPSDLTPQDFERDWKNGKWLPVGRVDHFPRIGFIKHLYLYDFCMHLLEYIGLLYQVLDG